MNQIETLHKMFILKNNASLTIKKKSLFFYFEQVLINQKNKTR
jgi:hypothetical protein